MSFSNSDSLSSEDKSAANILILGFKSSLYSNILLLGKIGKVISNIDPLSINSKINSSTCII